MTTCYKDFLTTDKTIGIVRLARTDGALSHCTLLDANATPAAPADWQRRDDDPLLNHWQAELEVYLRTGKHGQPPPLAPAGSEFQHQVWNALLDIPPGETRSYAQLAAGIGRPSAVRAVAGAIGRNPIAILIPCHRVIGSDGSLTGYAGGLERKAALLRREGVTC